MAVTTTKVTGLSAAPLVLPQRVRISRQNNQKAFLPILSPCIRNYFKGEVRLRYVTFIVELL